ncbi:aminotransferase class IV [Rhodobacteraceae bacterium B1Z28]|uniref:Probable branched-chain-amino-acid aminotransferase n=1 Tax=Ruegeria haliotis TaxID=2747601 RepID=A0ABX2PLR2_9RHOB|nr:aminotransferase class IV family protein [Ruegeria haliotis]NVO54411.1 aminotransferase class IV [Ruegeria haliotis]
MESPLCAPIETGFRLIETLAYRPEQGFVRRDRHLGRMTRSADALELPFSEESALVTLSGISADTALRCRLTMDVSGQFGLTTAPLEQNPSVWRLAIADTRVNSSDVWLRHKTTRRAIYDNARASMPEGVDELLFLNERDELCEGSITNLFIKTVGGRLLTPTLSCGLLPGVLREDLLEKEHVTEATLALSDLKKAQTVYMGNSLRGLVPVEMVNL